MECHPERPGGAAGTGGLGPELAAWIAEVTGAPLVAARRMNRWRPTWFVDVGTAGAVRELVLKSQRAPKRVIERSSALSEFGTRREAAMLRALQQTGVPVAPYVGFHDPSESLLMGKVGGTAILQSVPPERRIAPLLEYADALALLHSLDPDRLGLAGELGIPSTPEALALDNFLRFGHEDYEKTRSRLPTPEPMFDWALRWLERHVPRHRNRPALVQGDCGPNQFMFDEHGITAIVDWELGHVGDPLVDIAGFRLREVVYPTGAWSPFVERYQARSGSRIDPGDLAYYTVLVNHFSEFGLISTVQRPTTRHTETASRLWWEAAHRVMVVEGIAEASGLAPAVLAELPDRPTTRSYLFDYVVERLRDVNLPAAGDPDARREAYATYALSEVLRRAERLGPQLDEQTLEGLRALLGVRPSGVAEGLHLLDERLVADPEWKFEEVLTFFTLEARRRFALLEGLRWTGWWDMDVPTDFPGEIPAPDAPVLPPLPAAGPVAARPVTRATAGQVTGGTPPDAAFGSASGPPR